MEGPNGNRRSPRATAAADDGSRSTAPDLSLPLSFEQQRLWVLDALYEATASPRGITTEIRLRGRLNRDALRTGLNRVLARHEVLRNTFSGASGEPSLAIATGDGGFTLIQRAADEVSDLEQLSHTEVRLPFELTTGPLVRTSILQLADQDNVLLITLHSLIADELSAGIFICELAEFYAAFHEGRQDRLGSPPSQYAEYVSWQRSWLRDSVLESQIDYWRRHLDGATSELELPTDRSRPAIQNCRIGRVRVVLPAAATTHLRDLAQRLDATMFVVLLAGWAILLSRLSRQADVVIGTPTANRQRPERLGMIGPFANTLALRVNARDDLTVKEFLEKIATAMLKAEEHQEVPFQKIVEALQPKQDPSRHPIFQATFALKHAPIEAPHFPGLAVTVREHAVEQPLMDLSLLLIEQADQIEGFLDYASDLFDEETIERWARCLTALLSGLGDANEDRRIADLPMLPEHERYQVIELFNSTQAAYPQGSVIHELFEKQVEQTPNAIAVIDDGQPLSYAELNCKANQLARYLSGEGLQRGDYVPILMPRCLQMLIAQLAVLKCGCVYVPIDSAQPIERQSFMIQDCGAHQLLCIAEPPEGLERASIKLIDCSALAGAIVELPGEDLKLSMGTPLSPAYLMYTSGSTGSPKGVIVPHRAISRLVINGGYAKLERTDRIAHCSNPAFDASTIETWGALLNGATIVIVPQCILLEPTRFAEALTANDVTILCLTTALFNQLATVLSETFAKLRYLLVGGEAADIRTMRRVLRNGLGGELVNVYGPTETTTYATSYPTSLLAPEAKSVPIGRPISNTQTYILDGHLRPVPIGVIGEIYIGGPGVALGYLNRPALTSERFVVDPFSAVSAARMYRTGDLGRWRSDGIIEYCGRNDHQVKIRGFRIELGEIEARLAEDPRVKQSVVVAREDNPAEKRLVAYVVPHQSSGTDPILDVEGLRTHLKSTLPDYMIPSAFIALTELPLTHNGKLDRRALRVPGHDAYVSGKYEAPQGETEQTLAAIWHDILHVDRVGRNDDFFELGGNSLQSMALIRKVAEQFKFQLSTVTVFRFPTVRGLARIIQEGLTDSPPYGFGSTQYEEGIL